MKNIKLNEIKLRMSVKKFPCIDQPRFYNKEFDASKFRPLFFYRTYIMKNKLFVSIYFTKIFINSQVFMF